MGPVQFRIYTLPVADTICVHDTGFHLYTDDTQVYLSCECPGDPAAQKLTLSHLGACIADIRRRMPQNGLKLSDWKTEFLSLHSQSGSCRGSPYYVKQEI